MIDVSVIEVYTDLGQWSEAAIRPSKANVYKDTSLCKRPGNTRGTRGCTGFIFVMVSFIGH